MIFRQAASLFSMPAIVGLIALFPLPLWAQATLENPQPGSFQSGIGLISGWACEANRIAVQFNTLPPVDAAYGTDRGDTQGICGDTDNGFGLLFNWNLLGDGTHTVRVLADGMEFATARVTVTTLGHEFLRGVSGAFPLSDFPEAGTNIVLRWQETQQNFVIAEANGNLRTATDVTPSAKLSNQTQTTRATLENPQPGSFQSGIGLISGWACEANRIAVQFNTLPPVDAAYGTDRGDTQGICGDTDNGFGLLFNWNLLGDGTHTVRVLADGMEFATARVTVTTLGHEFLRGVSGAFPLSDFPEAGTNIVLRWQETQQNFVITEANGPRILVRRGENALTTGNLRAATDAFRQALQSAPNNPHANLYSALTRIVTPMLDHPELRSLASRSGVGIAGDSRDVCAIRVTLPQAQDIPSSAPRTGEIIQTLRRVLLPEIVAALASLNRISGTAEIRSDLMRLPACLFPTLAAVGLQRVLEQVEVEIDNSDLQALTASLQIVQAAFELAAAYELDAGLRLVTTQTSPAILDAEPGLLRLRSRAPLTTARNLLEHGLRDAAAALDALLAETDDQSDDLVVILPEGVSDVRLIRDTVESVRQSLTRIVTLPTELLDEPERLNLSLLFSGRFGTLRPFVPTYTFSCLGPFPDPTFGGISPDLTQQDINQQFFKGQISCR